MKQCGGRARPPQNERSDLMKDNKERDVSPQELRKAIDNLSLADKLFINAVMQMGLAFEAAKAMGKQS